MKLLYCPLNEPGSEQIGLERAFRKAFRHVYVFDYRNEGRKGFTAVGITEKFILEVHRFRPDFIHLQVQDSGQILPRGIREARRSSPGCRITHWNGDVRSRVSPYQSEICQACDLTLIPSTGQIPLFKAAGARSVRYWQVGVDPELDIPTNGSVEAWRANHGVEKVVFLANHYGNRFPNSQDRMDLVCSMKRAFNGDFGIYGDSWPAAFKPRMVRYREQKLVSAGALVTLGMNHFRGLDRYYSDRTALAVAAGTCHLLDHVPGVEAEYQPGRDIETFATIDEAVEKVRVLLADPDRAREIGAAGLRRALAEHTWDHRVEQYVDMLADL